MKKYNQASSFLNSDIDLCPVRNRAGPNVCGGTLCWCWHWFSGCENIKSGVTFHTESSFHMKISGLGGICHMSDVREEKISGRGHISCPGHCRPGALPAGRARRLGLCETGELGADENILRSLWTFRRWSLILIMRGNNVTLVSERWM